jgi:hypothetical protein
MHWDPYEIFGVLVCFFLSLSGGLNLSQIKSPQPSRQAIVQSFTMSLTSSFWNLCVPQGAEGSPFGNAGPDDDMLVNDEEVAGPTRPEREPSGDLLGLHVAFKNAALSVSGGQNSMSSSITIQRVSAGKRTSQTNGKITSCKDRRRYLNLQKAFPRCCVAGW